MENLFYCESTLVFPLTASQIIYKNQCTLNPGPNLQGDVTFVAEGKYFSRIELQELFLNVI